MIQAYGQTLLLYVVILVGAWFATVLGENMGVLLALIAGKTVLDLRFHLSEREHNAAASPTDLMKFSKDQSSM